MHIPDNYLSPSTCAVMGATMIPIWKRAITRVKQQVTKKRLPLLGIGAAVSFLIMMFNIPLIGGTTGHAVGATLLAILLGPYAACISISIALLVQAIFFGDGGLLALGANCFNMAFVMPFCGYYIYMFIKGKIKGEKAEYIASAIAAYIAINIAAFVAAIEFGIQPILFKDASGMPLYCPYPLVISIPAMLIPHLLLAGVLEAIITSGVYGFIKKMSPGVIYEDKEFKFKPLYGLIIAMIALSPIGVLASGTAWGEWGIEDIKKVSIGGKPLGYVPKGMENGFQFKGLMPDYSVASIPEKIGYAISALAGVAILLIIFKIITAKKNKEVRE